MDKLTDRPSPEAHVDAETICDSIEEPKVMSFSDETGDRPDLEIVTATKQIDSKLQAVVEDIKDCSICFGTLKDARILPCIHSFCLACITRFGEQNNTEKELPCPICRKIFSVPTGGMSKLPLNHFLNKLIDVNQIISTQNQDTLCNICNACKAVGTESAATGYCCVCNMSLCDRCVCYHKGIPATKKHKVFSLSEILNREELLNARVSHCEIHEDEQIKFYCYDCKTTACVVCYVTKHKEHKCSDVNESAEEVRKQHKDDRQKISECLQQCEDLGKESCDAEIQFLSEVNSAELTIETIYTELKDQLDAQRCQLLKELNEKKERRVKELKNYKEECEHDSVVLKSFVSYSEEMCAKGSSTDIMRSADDMDKRVAELVTRHEKTYDERKQCRQPDYYTIHFEANAGVKNSIRMGSVKDIAVLQPHCFDERSSHEEPCYEKFYLDDELDLDDLLS